MKKKIEPGDLLKASKAGNQKGIAQMMNSMKRKKAAPIERDGDMVMKKSKKRKDSKLFGKQGPTKKKGAVKCKSCGKVACKGSHAKKA